MSIKTSRTEGKAAITIDREKCASCGLCAKVCSGQPLEFKNGKVHINQQRLFGCIACGQCMAICPNACINITGRTMSPEDRIPLPVEIKADYRQLFSLLARRRSVRRYTDQEVEQTKIDQIIAAATQAPMGIPPSDVGILALRGKEKVRQFSFDFIELAARQKWLFSPWARTLLRPFLGKATVEIFKTFALPALTDFIEAKKRGKNHVLYDAPLAILFYNSAYSDPADASIAATYAMLAGEALGLGTCMIGSVAPFIRYSSSFKNKYGISPGMKDGLMVIFGYTETHYSFGLNRTFAQITYH